MRKYPYGGGVLVAAVALAGLVLPPRVDAQQRNRPGAPPVLMLEGLGSSVGLVVREADAEEARRGGGAGVVVAEVREGTPAARAGIRQADIVTEFDGERVRSQSQFARLVRETAPGRAVKMTVVRGSGRQTLEVTPEARGQVEFNFPDIAARVQRDLQNVPRDFPFVFPAPADPRLGFSTPRRLGVTVAPLSYQLAAYFAVKQGVLVTDVAANTPAEAAGLKAGDVITAIDGQPIANPNDVTRIIRDTERSSVEIHVTRERRDVMLTAKIPERVRQVFGRGGSPV